MASVLFQASVLGLRNSKIPVYMVIGNVSEDYACISAFFPWLTDSAGNLLTPVSRLSM